MKHFFTTKVKVALVAALLLAGVLAVLSSLMGTTVGDVLVKSILTPLRSGVSALTDRAEQFYSYMYRYEALAAENEALRAELAKIREKARDVESVKRENDRLRKMLQLTQNNPDYQYVDGYVIGKSSVDWTNLITLDVGTDQNVAPGMVAITENGEVVGLVMEAGKNYCVVKTVLDSSLEISGTIASSGYSGMVQGGYTTEEMGKLRMDYLPSSAVIRNNDQVVTSGSTVYPRNLILGYVIDAGFNDTGVAKFALLKSAADIDSLEQVFILTAFDQG